MHFLKVNRAREVRVPTSLVDNCFGGRFLSVWGFEGDPWGQSCGTVPSETRIRPNNRVDGLSGKF